VALASAAPAALALPEPAGTWPLIVQPALSKAPAAAKIVVRIIPALLLLLGR
jgi:hypothetical protein